MIDVDPNIPQRTITCLKPYLIWDSTDGESESYYRISDRYMITYRGGTVVGVKALSCPTRIWHEHPREPEGTKHFLVYRSAATGADLSTNVDGLEWSSIRVYKLLNNW